jgi:transcriptional regulator GlxA family with amidase domain
MTNSPPTGGSDAVAAPLAVAVDRVRVKVRRRRPRQGQQAKWTARAHRRAVRIAFVCAGTLLLLAAALYFGLSYLSAGPGIPEAGVAGIRGVA